MKTAIALCAFAMLLGSSARAQVNQPELANQPIIAVFGVGEASKPAEYATLQLSYRGEGKTQVDALQALSQQRARVEDGLSRLAGATRIKLEASDLRVSEVLSKGCDTPEPIYPPMPPAPRPGCTIEGHVAVITVWAQVTPAEASGDAVSLASQLGAVQAGLRGGDVIDPQSLEQTAMKAALANAQAKAEAIAAASGLKLGPLLRVQDQRVQPLEDLTDEGPNRRYTDQATRVELFKNTPPKVPLNLAPPPVRRQVLMTVIYSIQR